MNMDGCNKYAKIVIWLHVCSLEIPYKFACGSALSLRNCLTFDHAPVSPYNPHAHTHFTSSHPGQLSAWTWPKKRDPSVVFLQRSGFCMCVCVPSGGTPLFTGLIPAVVLSRGLWHTSKGYGCFKSRHHNFHV